MICGRNCQGEGKKYVTLYIYLDRSFIIIMQIFQQEVFIKTGMNNVEVQAAATVAAVNYLVYYYVVQTLYWLRKLQQY